MQPPYVTEKQYNDVTYFRLLNGKDGQPRYVIHYTEIPFRNHRVDETFFTYQREHIEHAKQALNGTEYRAKWMGGGIVFTSPNIEQTIDDALMHTERNRFKTAQAIGDHEYQCVDPLNCATLTDLIIERNLWR